MDQVKLVLDNILNFLNSNSSVIGVVFGVLFSASKFISTEKALPIISAIQLFFDSLAKMILALGNVLAKLSEYLANAIKSDGMLGKQ